MIYTVQNEESDRSSHVISCHHLLMVVLMLVGCSMLFARLGALGRCVSTLLLVGVTLVQLIALGPPVLTFKELTGAPRVSGPIVILVLALWPVAPPVQEKLWATFHPT